MSSINLETSRLIIKPLTLADAPSVYKYRSLEEVSRFQMFYPHKLTDALRFIKSTSVEPNIPDSWYQLGMFLKANNNLIGDIGIHFLVDQDETELGCTVAPEYWRKGYAKENLEAVISLLSRALKKKRIIANISIANVRSRRLFERLGFKFVSQSESEVMYQLINRP